MFDSTLFSNTLQTKVFGKNFIYFPCIDSTNTYAKQIVSESAKEGTIILSDEQTHGLGRQQRNWISENGKNLTFSIILRPTFFATRSSLLPFVFALGVAKTFSKKYHLSVECKWPNDILFNDKKLCGMLLESSFHKEKIDYIIIGIGLNVNQESFPEELEQTATSLFLGTKQEWNREELLANILLQCESEYLSFCESESSNILEQWKSFSSMFGKEISIHQNGKVVNGIAVDIATNGELLVNVENKLVKFSSADVSVRDSKLINRNS